MDMEPSRPAPSPPQGPRDDSPRELLHGLMLPTSSEPTGSESSGATVEPRPRRAPHRLRGGSDVASGSGRDAEGRLNPKDSSLYQIAIACGNGSPGTTSRGLPHSVAHPPEVPRDRDVQALLRRSSLRRSRAVALALDSRRLHKGGSARPASTELSALLVSAEEVPVPRAPRARVRATMVSHAIKQIGPLRVVLVLAGTCGRRGLDVRRVPNGR